MSKEETTDFGKLLADLEQFGKALPAAGDGKGDGKGDDKDPKDGAGAGGGEGGDGEGDGADGEEFAGKSFEVVLPDGSKVQALDGTELVKALHAELVTTRGQLSDVSTTLAKAMQAMAKGFAPMRTALEEQGELIKSLRTEVATLRGSGTGRRAVLNVHEKQDTGGGGNNGGDQVDGRAVLAKAIPMIGTKGITAHDCTLGEARLNNGLQLDPDFVARVNGA